MATPLHVLLIGLQSAGIDPVLVQLRRAEFIPEAQTAASEDELLRHLDPPPDLIISEQSDHAFGAQQVLRILREQGLSVPLIVLAQEPTVQEAVESLREGALDYLGRNQLSRLGSAAVLALSRGEARQRMLADSEQRYRTLVESMNEGMLSVDKDTKITFVNAAYCRMLGYEPQELLGRSALDILAEEEAERVKAELAKRATGAASTYELKLRTKQGQNIICRVSAVPLFDEKGNFLGSNSIVTDLTELRKAEEGMRKAAREWRQTFDAIDDIVVVNDLDQRIQRCNRALAEAVGLPIKQILGQSYYKLVFGLDAPPRECPHEQVMQTGEPAEIEMEIPKLGHTAVISVSPIKGPQGEVTGTVHIIRDISEKRAREQETLDLTKALVESFQATTLALTSMVESRDPYTSGHTQGVAELCQKVGQALGLSQDDLQGLRVCALLHDIGKGAIPLDILNKPGKLSSHEMGIIREHPTTAYHILKGISFPWPVAEVVWQHHERLDGSGYPRGLTGDEIHPWAKILAVCDVVEAMTSHRPYRPSKTMQEAFRALQEGVGILFDSGGVQATISALGLDQRRLLVVDDDPAVLNVLTTYLDREGLQVEGFSDPAQAVAAFQDNPTPVVLTDLKMPGMSGLEVLRAVKERNHETEVIVITGHGDKTSVVAAMRMGASDFLEKPVKLSDLSDAVRRARRRYSGEASLGGD